MADYKELLRRAVEALPENNGAARRAVYEKARAALVGQLRAINPPLAARDITAHRLQLEDCIRQVEQEASEAVIAGLGSSREESPPPPPVYFEPPVKKAPTGVAKPVAKPPLAATPTKEPPRPLPAGASIEEIIAAANAEHVDTAPDQTRSVSRPDAKPAGKPVPKLVQQPQQPAPRAVEAKVAKRPEPPKPQPEPEYIEVQEDEPEALVEDEPIEIAPRAVPERVQQPAMRAPVKPVPTAPTGRPLPSIVARAEAAKSRSSAAPAVGAPIDGARRGPSIEPRREVAAARIESGPRSGPAFQQRAAAQPATDYDDDVLTAMSAVREVEMEPVSLDPQGAIDRAIATLDREARADADGDGESQRANGRDIEAALSAPLDDRSVLKKPVRKPRPPEVDEPEPRPRRAEPPTVARNTRDDKTTKPAKATAFAPAAKVRPQGKRNLALEADSGFPRGRQERNGFSAVTIFLMVFAVLLVGAGGAGVWAWREGYINLDQMFGRGGAATETAATATTAPAASASAEAPATGPGNTAAPTEPAQSPVELKQEERLGADPSVAASQSAALPLQDPAKADSRLASTDDSAAAAASAAIDPAAAAGSQSLLLEAQSNGTTGAVPYSGTVEWSRGKDEMGLPTLIAKANIPARNLAVDVLIRKNSDPSLPASHLMEVNFRVNDSFVGGSIAGLPGVLLKNEELVQGTPLVGASARVVGNSFLFALSARPEDIAANAKLLTDRKWMDLALIYATGQRAIITLEKDDQATSLFNEVVAEWGSKTAATP
jgi:hypothetical protein